MIILACDIIAAQGTTSVAAARIAGGRDEKEFEGVVWMAIIMREARRRKDCPNEYSQHQPFRWRLRWHGAATESSLLVTSQTESFQSNGIVVPCTTYILLFLWCTYNT